MQNQTHEIEKVSFASLPEASQPGFGGMNQVTCGPAGLLYSLSNELIYIYNELQDLYGKVATAETLVQQSTIKAGAAASRAAAEQQSYGIYAQAAEAIAGGAVTAVANGFESRSGAKLDDEMETVETGKAPLVDLNDIVKDPTTRMVGNRPVQDQEVSGRIYELKTGDYAHKPGQDAVLDKKAIDGMEPDDFVKFKENLNNEIIRKEKLVNTLQTKRQVKQSTFNSYSQLASQVTNTIGKAVEASYAAKQGQEQAIQQTSSGVQQMAGSTADSSRGSIGQDYAKVSDAIAAARQGAQAYAQT